MKKTIRKCRLAFVALLLVVCTPACKQDNREPQSTAQSEVAKPDAYADLDLSLGLSTEMIDEGAVMGREMPRSEARTNITLTKNKEKFVATFNDDANSHTTMRAVIAIRKKSDATLYLTKVEEVKKTGDKSFRIQANGVELFRVPTNGGSASSVSSLPMVSNTGTDAYEIKVFLGATLKDNKTIAYGVEAQGLTRPTAIEPILTGDENAEVKLKNAYGNVPFVNEDWKMLKLEPSTRPDRNKMLTLRMDPKDNIKLKPQGSLMVVALKNETDYTHTITEMGFYSSALTQRGHYVYNNNSFDYKPLSAGGSEAMGDSDWVNFKFTSEQLRVAGFGDKGFRKDKTCYVYFWAMSPLASTISQAAFTQALFRTTRYDTGDKHEREYTYPAYASIGSLRGLVNGKVSTTKASINLSTHRPHPLELAASLWSWDQSNTNRLRLRRGNVGGSYLQTEEDLKRLAETPKSPSKTEAEFVHFGTSVIRSKTDENFEVPTYKVNNKTGEFIGTNNTESAVSKDTYYIPSIPELYGIFPAFNDQNNGTEDNRTAFKKAYPITDSDGSHQPKITKTIETVTFRRPNGITATRATYSSFYARFSETVAGQQVRVLYGIRFLREEGGKYCITPYTSIYKYEWLGSWTDRSSAGRFSNNNDNYSKLRITARLLGGMNEYDDVNLHRLSPAEIYAFLGVASKAHWWNAFPLESLDIHRTYPALGYGDARKAKVYGVGGHIQIRGYETKAGNSGGRGGLQNVTWKCIWVKNYTEERDNKTKQNKEFFWVDNQDKDESTILLMRHP